LKQFKIEDIEYQKKKLEAIYSAASLAPILKSNAKYCTGQFAALTPYIASSDVMDYKFIIRATSDYENKADSNSIIIEYTSLDELVIDDWRVD
jgi:hypothetical protein